VVVRRRKVGAAPIFLERGPFGGLLPVRTVNREWNAVFGERGEERPALRHPGADEADIGPPAFDVGSAELSWGVLDLIGRSEDLNDLSGAGAACLLDVLVAHDDQSIVVREGRQILSPAQPVPRTERIVVVVVHDAAMP